jgi:hypothetical protein
MTEIPVGHALLSIEFRMIGDAEPMFTTAGLKLTPGAPPGLQTLVNSLYTPIANFHASLSVPSVTLEAVALRYTDVAGADPLMVEKRQVTAGSNTGGSLPPNVSYLIVKRTAVGGRKNKGRFFWPGVRAAVVGGEGIITAAAIAGTNTNLEVMRNGIENTAGVDDLVIFHSAPLGGTAAAPTPITSLLMDPKVATQRRRLR